MSNAVYPALPGLKFPISKQPSFSTLIQRSISGKEVRVSMMSYPDWVYELSYDFLKSSSPELEYQNLIDFFLARNGAYDTFLFDDASDNAVTDHPFGTGNGTDTVWQLIRTLDALGFAEPVQNLNGSPIIKVNGVTQSTPSQYTINSTGVVTFVTAPANGFALTWTGSYRWRMRFERDLIEFRQFVSDLWELRQVALKRVKV